MSNKISYSEAKDLSEARHVLGLSGGKDSAALAIYIKDRYPELHDKSNTSLPIQVPNLRRSMTS